MIKILNAAIILIIYAIVNGFVLLLFVYDKRNAQVDARRIPENVLLLFAFYGPFGACAAMRLFRHKTRKAKFYLVLVFLILHTVLIIYTMSPGFTTILH
jgi:uncharacterized membrane protein YsdA (DUF1294 family)